MVKRIVGLKGTPSSNGLIDLSAEFKILDMSKRLGYFIGQYRSAYFRPDKINGPVVYSYKPLANAEQAIYEKISDITVSMKANEHLKMPELVDLKREIMGAIRAVPDMEHQTIIEKRYLCFISREQMAIDMNYSIQHIHRMHSKADLENDR